MFIEGQDSVKKEMIKHFSTEDFAWIDDIFLEEEGEYEQEEERIEDIDRVFVENAIGVENMNVTETREEETANIPPPL